MVALIIIIALVALMFYAGSDKAQERGHDWIVVLIILLGFIVITIFGIKSCVHDSSHSPSYDYYDDRTPR